MHSPRFRDVALRMISSAVERLSEENSESNRVQVAFPWTSSRVAALTGGKRDFEEMRADIEVTRVVEELLQRLLTSARATIARFENRLTDTANGRLFHTLPNEILALIFEMAFEEEANQEPDRYPWRKRPKLVQQLSLVSRRFRDVVLNLPILWSWISSSEQHLEKAKLFASRSTTPNIAMSIDGVYASRGVESEIIHITGMYKLAVSVASRIRSMSITFTSSDVRLIGKISQICSSVSLPALNELSLARYGNVGRNGASICSDWDMPCLRKLTAINTIPSFNSDIASRIETCHLEANRDSTVAEPNDQGFWRTSEIVEFLLSLTSVKNLDVALQLFLLDDEIGLQNESVMGSVRNLTVGLQNTAVGSGWNILDYIRFPDITAFKLEIGLTGLDHLEDVLETATSSFVEDPPSSVTELTLAVNIEYEDYEGRMPVHVIGEWCKMFGDLKSFTVESERDKTHGLFAFASSIDSLRLVDLKGDSLCGEFLADLPSMWDRPYRGAVLDMADVGNWEPKKVIRYTDKRN